MSQVYNVNEIFQSLQGEGAYTGAPSIFVRIQGCPVGCPWCDTQHTWKTDPELQIPVVDGLAKQEDSPTWFNVTPEALLEVFAQQGYSAKHVIITGGEPCMFDLRPLSHTLIEAGFSVQVETSGTFDIQIAEAAWVTVSPKVAMPGGYEVLTSALCRADEIKHPIAMEKHVEELQELLALLPEQHQPRVYLQPISQKPRATQLAIDTCIKHNWRLSLQTHKYLGIA